MGVDRQRDALLKTVTRFAEGASANNALLWGARGTGKSFPCEIGDDSAGGKKHPALKLVEIEREAVKNPAKTSSQLCENRPERFVVLCDDLSFEEGAGGGPSR